MNSHLLKKVQEEIGRCRKCGSCQAVCPVYDETLDEACSPRGKIALAEAMLTGKLKPKKALLDRLSRCLSCSACTSSCVNRVNTVEILNFTKNRIFYKKRLLSIPQDAMASVLKSSTASALTFRIVRRLITLYNSVPSAKMKLLPKLNRKRYFPDPGKGISNNRFAGVYSADTPSQLSVLFFPGCLAEITEGNAIKEIIGFLSELGVHVSIPPGLVCCGAPAYYKGDYATTKELMHKNARILSADKNKPTCIVTACATCGHVLKGVYSQLWDGQGSLPLKLPVMDIQEFLLSIPGFKGSLGATEEPLPGKKIKITYHDPCHLKRGQNIHNEPRALLKALPEVEFIEMKNADRCCGGGGTFCFTHPSISQGVAKHKAEAIKDSGASIVTTACPSCRLQLADMTEGSDAPVEVIHTVELIKRVLKERNKKRPKSEGAKAEGKLKTLKKG